MTFTTVMDWHYVNGPAAAIPTEIKALERSKIRSFITVVVSLKSSHHARPCRLDAQVATALTSLFLCILIHHSRLHTQQLPKCIKTLVTSRKYNVSTLLLSKHPPHIENFEEDSSTLKYISFRYYMNKL